jgi:hypothetical protein
MKRFRQCLVHGGTHKTGTTTVQHVMAARRADLAASGFLYPPIGAEGRDHNALAHRLATCGEEQLGALADELLRAAAELHPVHAEADTLVISAEELSTRIGNADPWAGFDQGDYWEQRRHFLSRLRRLLPQAAPIEVYVCFRDHESYAHALYATKVLSGKIGGDFGDFGDFVRRCAPIFDYRRQVDVLAQTLGPVHVESYDRLRADLANRFFAWTGLPLRVEQTPRLRPTPPLDVIYWLSRALHSPAGREEHARRAAFCRDREPVAGADPLAVESLWSSARQRLEFLRRCEPPPLDAWTAPTVDARIAEPRGLERRADEIEAQYRRWLASGGRRRHWAHFWRRT